MIWLVLLACTGPVDGPAETGADTGSADTDTEMPPITIELGGGELDHQPLSDGDPVILVHGPQGGWHVDVSARVGGTSPYVSMDPDLYLLADPEMQIGGVLQNPTHVVLADYSDEALSGDVWGGRSYLDYDPNLDLPTICAMGGEPVRLTLQITDVDGRVETASIDLVAQLDPNGGINSDADRCAAAGF